MLKIYFILFLLIPIMALGQERQTLKAPNVSVIPESLSPIDPNAEIQIILEKTDIDSSQIKQMKKMVMKYAKMFNQYCKQDSLTTQDYFALKELETRHKFEIKKLLGEHNYRKLFVVVPLD